MDVQPIFHIESNMVLFFDLDGTLLDTDRANYLAYNKAFKVVLKSDSDLIYNFSHRLNRTFLKDIIPNLSESQFEEIVLRKEEFYADFINEISLITSNLEVLNYFNGLNRIYLITNSRKERAYRLLNFFGLEKKFDDIFYREGDNSGRKINKYKNAISKLNLDPTEVVAFENEDVEIKYALEAGIKIINPKLFLI